MSNSSDNSKKGRWSPWLLLFPGVIILWVMSWTLSSWGYPEIECRGQFGDSFGAVNALFAGLAFAGVIYAIILQKKELGLQRDELGLQRKELEDTRAEIKGQKEQLQAQNQTLQKQNFENSFFQLLSRHSEIVNSMAIPGAFFNDHNKEYTGRQCFVSMFSKLAYIYEASDEQFNAGMQPDADSAKNLRYKWLNDKYEEFFPNFQPYVGHYFRHLYNIVKFIDQNTPEIIEKSFYIDLIRAQLSSTELGLLFYHGLSDRGAEFRVLVEKYALFEHIPSESLIREGHKELYDQKAYTPG